MDLMLSLCSNSLEATSSLEPTKTFLTKASKDSYSDLVSLHMIRLLLTMQMKILQSHGLKLTAALTSTKLIR